MKQNIYSPMEVRECDYKGEHYSVREDGMVLRHPKQGLRKRKFDGFWTAGVLNAGNGYLYISTARAHIIVATAFHGIHDSKIYVVDHIDTNRQNNRPENLRWMTRTDNVLKNEITRKKIELKCGSIEAFLENPSLFFRDKTDKTNLLWMKRVNKEEARNSYEHWKEWARTTTATHDPNYKKGTIGDWIFQKPHSKTSSNITTSFENKIEEQTIDHYSAPEPQPMELKEYEDCLISDSLTPLAAQYHWKTPTEFPCCPDVISGKGLQLYKDKLEKGKLFTSNEYSMYYVVDKGMWTEGNELIVLATDNKDAFLSWSIVSIYMRNGKYVHKSIERMANKELATKYFKYLIGDGTLTAEEIEWLDCL